MILLVVRHASAEDSGPRGDASRRLSDRGRMEAERAGAAIQKLGPVPEVVLASPAIRATETADLLVAQLAPSPVIVPREEIYRGIPSQDLSSFLEPYQGKVVALVGHMPDVSNIVSVLTGQSVGFRPSSVCCLELEGEGGQMKWFKTPDELAALAGNS